MCQVPGCRRHAGIFVSVMLEWSGNIGLWPRRLSVRTSGFHPGKRSSTLLGVTTYCKSKSLCIGGSFLVNALGEHHFALVELAGAFNDLAGAGN